MWSSSAFHQVVRFLSSVFSHFSFTRPTEYSHPRSQEEELKTKNVWLKGHTGT